MRVKHLDELYTWKQIRRLQIIHGFNQHQGFVPLAVCAPGGGRESHFGGSDDYYEWYGKQSPYYQLVEVGENAAVEFKRAKGGVPADFWPSYSAFANTDGGIIVFGIHEKDGKREIEGLPNADELELAVEKRKVGEKTSEVMVISREVGVKRQKVGVIPQEMTEKTPEVMVNPDFEVLMGAFRNDFRTNARRVLAAFSENPEQDTAHIAHTLNISENSVWRAVRALKDVGLLAREGAARGGKWIVKK